MFHRALIPLDGTADAETALDHVAPLMAANSEAVLLHVLPEPRPLAADTLPSWLDLQRRTEEYLARVPSRGSACRIRTFVDVGDPSERILAVGEALQADVLALTTHAWKGWPRSGLGTIARRVLRSADRAVLFAPPGRPPWGDRLGRILLPLENPGWATEDLDPIIHLASGLNAEVIVLHVDAPSTDPLEGRRTDPPLSLAAHDRARRYRETADYLRSFGVEAKSVLIEGPPARRILEQAKALDAPLIALRTHGRRGLERLVAGSVSEEVIRFADRPVLLLPPSPVRSIVNCPEISRE